MRVQEPDFIYRARRGIAKRGDQAIQRLRPRSTESTLGHDPSQLLNEIQLCVSPLIGETAARRKAIEIGEHYSGLDTDGQQAFFELLADSFGVERTALDAAIAQREAALASAPAEQAAVIEAERLIRQRLVSPRELLFTRFNGLRNGVKFVVDLRADLRALKSGDPRFKAMDAELKDLLGSWFDVGLLELRQITWDTPASILEKLIAYESVHEIESWDDLKNRLDMDRRCYAFFHPGMPDEPLIFVEVALVQGLAGDLAELLDLAQPVHDPAEADTAIFYSISNCQRGLAGVNLGDLLIKQVVGALLQDLPHLQVFSTLSPIPGFRAWLDVRLADADDAVLRPDEVIELRKVLPPLTAGVEAAVLDVIKSPDWPSDTALAAALSAPMTRLGAEFIVNEKRNGSAFDRVANFHLSNGARVERLNWMANTAPAGLERAASLMVNYRYVPEYISQNHERYVVDGDIAVARNVNKLLSVPD